MFKANCLFYAGNGEARKPAAGMEETRETQKLRGETKCKQSIEVQAGLTLIALWRAERN